MRYEKVSKLSIRNHPDLSERWAQERIAGDPSILELGDVILKDKERSQANAGRIVEHWGIPDRFALLHQLGLLARAAVMIGRGAAAARP